MASSPTPLTGPFTPKAGAVPPVLAERQTHIDDFAHALDQGPGAHARASFIVGEPRVGKSALLSVFEEVSTSRGWATTCIQGSPETLETLDRVGIVTTNANQEQKFRDLSLVRYGGQPDFESHLLIAARELQERQSGLFVALDNAEAVPMEDLQRFSAAFAHVIAQRAPVAFAITASSAAANELVTANVSSYLQRAHRIALKRLTDAGVVEALVGPLREQGRLFTAEGLKAAMALVSGRPDHLQALGAEVFKETGPGDTIDEHSLRCAAHTLGW